MIWTLKNTVEIGKPVRVFDANWTEIRFCLEANDETGECVVFRSNRKDAAKLVFSSDRTRIVRQRIICKPPLHVVPS